MLFDINSLFAKSKSQNNSFSYYPDYYSQDSSKSIVGESGKYDLTRFSQHEADVVRKVLSVVAEKYPTEYQSLGLVNESYVITYKPRYVLFEIAVIKYKDAQSPYGKFAAAYAFANKGADYRLAALGEFEESIGEISFDVLDEFVSLNSASICILFSKLYEQEWEFDSAIYWLKMALRRGGLNDEFLKGKINEIETKKKNVERSGKQKRNRKTSAATEEFENDVHNAAMWFLQE